MAFASSTEVRQRRPSANLRRVLVGRAAECAALGSLIEGAREGSSGALVLAGEAGIGKSALLELTVELAGGFHVAFCAGVPSEARLGYAALHRVLHPFLDRI